MLLTTAIVAPVMVICCGGGVALIGAGLAGLTAYLSGTAVWVAALFAVSAGMMLLAMRRRKPAGRKASKRGGPG